MLRLFFVSALVLVIVRLLHAAGEPATAPADSPKSVAVKAAIAREEAAIKHADETYQQAVIAAKRQCIRDLDAAIKSSMQSGNLDAANEIAVTKKRLAAEIDDLVANSTATEHPEPAAKGPPVYLDTLDETSVKGTQWVLAKHGFMHDTMPITMKGAKFPHGMGLNPIDRSSAFISYKLPGHFKRLSGAAGINDSGAGFASKITFHILGDGHELWRSNPTNKVGIPIPFDVDISKVESLDLVSDCEGGAGGAHVVWLDPRLTGGMK